MILVTGATGFVGSELIHQLLLTNKRVRAIKRSTSKIPALLQKKPIEWIDADMLDFFALQEAFAGVEYVYHCAAIVSFNPKEKEKIMRTNIEGTSNIVNLSIQNNIKKLVHVSSVAALGQAKNGALITEKNYWEFKKDLSNYAISKYESEMEVQRAIVEGLNAVIVNPSIILGKNSGLNGSIQLFKVVKKGLPFYTKGSCGFVDVTDVATFMIALMESDINNERFILNSENRHYKSFFSEIARNYNLKPPTIEAKPWMLKAGVFFTQIASALTGKTFGLNAETSGSAITKQEFSSQKVKQALELKFKPLSQTIKDVCENS